MRLDEIDTRTLAATEGPWVAAHRTSLDWLSRSESIDATGHQPGSNIRPVDATDSRWGSVWPNLNAHADAEFIAHAREDVPAMSNALRAVLDLHAPETSEDVDFGEPWCVACGDASPCPTELAIITHLEGRPT